MRELARRHSGASQPPETDGATETAAPDFSFSPVWLHLCATPGTKRVRSNSSVEYRNDLYYQSFFFLYIHTSCTCTYLKCMCTGALVLRNRCVTVCFKIFRICNRVYSASATLSCDPCDASEPDAAEVAFLFLGPSLVSTFTPLGLVFWPATRNWPFSSLHFS